MPWTPGVNEPQGKFEGQVVENLLTILTRDFKNGLDYYYLSDNLPDFRELELGPPLRNIFPCGAIEPIGSVIDASEDNSVLAEVCRVRLYITVTGDGAKATTRKLFKYVRVAHLVLRSARADFFTDMSSGHGVIFGEFNHVYDVTREK